jgi:uncharacterized membrane protein YhaH (DUF805 family)
MGFVDAVKAFYKNYLKFDGRALRSEYWWPQLFFILLYVVMFAGAALLGETIGGVLALVISLVILASIIPAISVTVRRLHDVDKSGWFFLLALVPIVNFYVLYLTIIKGTDGPNRFGSDPLGSDSAVFN